jgi:hypothetical protein
MDSWNEPMKNISLAFLVVTFFSCISEQSVVRPEGSSARIKMKGGTVLDAELLAIREGNLVCRGDSVMEIPFAAIFTIDLLIEESRGWVAPVIIFQALPSALILYYSEEAAVGLAALGITALTYISFELSGPKVHFFPPLSWEDAEILRLYMRYPYGLTEEQVWQLKIPQ